MRQITKFTRIFGHLIAAAGLTSACTESASETATGPTCTQQAGTICTVAGTGTAGLGHDDLAPTEVLLYLPQDVTPSDDGKELYIADWNNHRIRLVENGKVKTLIGTGYLGDAPDGPALGTSLNHPTHIAFSPTGKLIVSAWHNSKVLEVDLTSNTLKAICGTGARSYGGDGGPADKAVLDLPVAVDYDSQGRMVISDQANQRIRRVEKDGTIDTIAGPAKDFVPDGFEKVTPEGAAPKLCKKPTDPAAPAPTDSRLADGSVNNACLPQSVFPQGFSGDGGPAKGAMMSQSFGQSAPPSGRLEIGPDDTIYFADTFNHRVRAIDAEGMIRTFAGSGPATFDATYAGGYEGDGGPAVSAKLKYPVDVAVSDSGKVFIADKENSCVRVVGTDGIIDTFAGVCGQRKFGGDGGAANAAFLNRPYGVALDGLGNLYIADTHNHRIRVVYGADN